MNIFHNLNRNHSSIISQFQRVGDCRNVSYFGGYKKIVNIITFF